MVKSDEKRIMSILVDNEPGVLARVVGMFSGCGYNIDGLNVAEIDNEKHLSRITLTTTGDDEYIKQISAQVSRVVPVHRCLDLTKLSGVERELAMVKVRVERDARKEVLELAERYNAKPVDVIPGVMIFEVVGRKININDFVKAMKPFGVIEVARTGVIAMACEESL